jgi:hypothetical protein
MTKDADVASASDESEAFAARADALYALPLEEFVAGRKRLADELKRQGARDDARKLAGLPKPSASAWLTNQTVRQAHELVRALLAATDEVAAAQRQLPAAQGGSKAGASDFAAAVASQRKILAQLAERARATGASASDEVLDRVANNFRWGAITASDRDALARGRLIRDVAAPGFGGFGEVSATPAAAVAHEHVPVERHAKTDARDAAEAARAAAQAERERKAAIARHEAALREAEHEVARARRDLAHAEKAHAAADQRVTDAEAALEEARDARVAADHRREEAASALTEREAAQAKLRQTGPDGAA